MNAVTLRSTLHSYGATKHPALHRISGMLNHCPNLKSLDITYIQPRVTSGSLPSLRPPMDEFLLYSRWPQLTSLVLTNLRCSATTGFESAATFLFAHLNLEVLHLDVGGSSAGTPTGSTRLVLPPNSLPRLKELKASKEIANSILECPCERQRPLEILKGFRLYGSSASTIANRNLDFTFFTNLKPYATQLKRVELAGWNDMEDIRRLVETVPGLTWLDLGKKTGVHLRDRSSIAPVSNIVEWTTLLAELPELAVLHGVRFFYEVTPQAAAAAAASTTATAATELSIADRSRIRKNDEIASMLVWKCPKLRRLDHWEEGGGKVIVLTRDTEKDHHAQESKVKWEVRRIKV